MNPIQCPTKGDETASRWQERVRGTKDRIRFRTSAVRWTGFQGSSRTICHAEFNSVLTSPTGFHNTLCFAHTPRDFSNGRSPLDHLPLDLDCPHGPCLYHPLSDNGGSRWACPASLRRLHLPRRPPLAKLWTISRPRKHRRQWDQKHRSDDGRRERRQDDQVPGASTRLLRHRELVSTLSPSTPLSLGPTSFVQLSLDRLPVSTLRTDELSIDRNPADQRAGTGTTTPTTSSPISRGRSRL